MEQLLADAPRFVVSARKYRPATFNTVVGQGHVTTALQNAVQSGKLAQAFLFCGPRGVGKTTCARILAKTINCTARTPDTEACDQCDSCRAFNGSASFNVHELDAASNNSVDDIRALVEQVRYAPQAGRYKVYIIDEVHMLSNAAFNAFLKTLEEPPAHAIFILATTERHKIIPTILSRCQTFDFNRIRPEDMVKHLAHIATQEGVTAEPDGLHLIAQKADGGLRDALSIFDQIVTFSGGNITYRAVADNLHVLDYDTYFRLTAALLAEDHAAALLLFDEVLRHGFDGHLFVTGWASHLRDLLVSQTPATVALLEVADSVKARYAQQAQAAPAAWLLSGLTLAGACDREYKQARHQRLHVELLLLRAAHLRSALRFADGVPVGAAAAASIPTVLPATPLNGGAKKKNDVGPRLVAAGAPP
ncbi:MAG: DNA polymerase III subunit gamma/tau, partial [Hymenobacteraceae bacterium]|nr:DNA polymerase III subunit gamma/tau [Hymenobacteraceae bacterium]